VSELAVQIIEIAEAAGEEEVLPDVAERPLDFTLGLRAVRRAGLRVEAIVARKVDERGCI
jgi:hypothetical protein